MRLGKWAVAVTLSLAVLASGSVVADRQGFLLLAQTQEADQPDSSWKPLGLIKKGVGKLGEKMSGSSEDASGENAAQSTKGDRIFSSDPLPLDWIGELAAANPKLVADLGIAEIDWEGIEARNVEGTFQLRDGRIDITISRLELGPGRVTGHVTLDPTTTPMSVNLEVLANNIRVEDLRKFDQPGLLTDGTIDLKLKLSGQGESLAALMASAEGEWDSLIEDGRAVSASTEKAGGPMLALDLMGALVPSGLDSTAIRCAVSRVKVEAGVAIPEVLIIVAEHTLISGNGSVDLGRESIDLMFVPQQSSNVQGVLLPPIQIGGTFANPSFRPAPLGNITDIGSIAKLIASPLLTPALAISGEKHDCTQELKKAGTQSGSKTENPPTDKESEAADDG